ncbi:HNH endonuclease signature motif containing protein, partial [Pseudoclavibacter sp. RFBI4]
FLKARDIHCRFIGCRQPATNCELDHTIDHQYGGTTATWNLSDFCKNHHIIKHHTAWTVTQHDGGTLEWTTPSGKTYTDHPEPHGPTFTPTDDLPWRRGSKPPRERDEDPPPAAPSAPPEPPF